MSAYVRGAEFVEAYPDELSEIAAKYIGNEFLMVICKALDVNPASRTPTLIRKQAAIDREVIGLNDRAGLRVAGS